MHIYLINGPGFKNLIRAIFCQTQFTINTESKNKKLISVD